MKAIVKRVGEDPVVEEIRDKLADLQAIVGGLIEPIGIEAGVDLVCNDEGKIRGLRMNIAMMDMSGDDDESELLDIVHGDCFLIGVGDEGCFISLTDEQIGKYMEMMNTRFIVTRHFDFLPVIEI